MLKHEKESELRLLLDLIHKEGNAFYLPNSIISF